MSRCHADMGRSSLHHRCRLCTWLIHRLYLVCFIVGLVLPDLAQAQSVTQDFARARLLHEKGEREKAARILIRNVKKYPDHQPSLILLGRIYWSLGDSGKAQRLFSRVPPEMIPPDAAFEYGAAMFAENRFERAIKGFSKVPPGPLRDIAHFYTGVSWMRLKQWHKAGISLRRAEKLPANLASARRRLLRTLQEREREDRFSGAQPWVPSLPPPPAPPVPQLPQTERPAGKSPPPKKAEPPPLKQGFGWSATPTLTATSVQQRDDNHGFRTTKYEGRTLESTVALGVRHDSAPRAFGGQAAWTLNLDLGRYSNRVKGESVAFKAYDDDPSAVFTEVKELNVAAVTTSYDGLTLRTLDAGETWDGRVTLGTLQPLTESLDLEFKYSAWEKYPGLGRDRKIGTRTPSARLAVEVGTVTLEGNFAMSDLIDVKGTAQNDMTFGVRVTKNYESVILRGGFTHIDTVVPAERPKVVPKSIDTGEASLVKNWESLSLTGLGRWTSRAPMPGETLAGALVTQRGELTGKWSFELGSVTATGFYSVLDQFLFKGLDHPTEVGSEGKPVKIDVAAGGTQQGATIAARLAPLPWLWASSGYTIQQSAWVTADPTLQKKFEAANNELRTIFTWAVGVSRSF
jgi:tetratricopeptide (TPR) repeat protein